ncbi:MAG: hypothetical protein ACREB9_05435 [Thermoplasmata archaeon]
MTSTSSPAPTPFSIVLTSAATYAILVVALVMSVGFSYVYALFPTSFGDIGIATSLTGIVAYISHDLTAAHTPNGWPTWTTFVVVSVATAAYAAIGAFTSTTLMELGAGLTWGLAFASFLNTYVGEYGATSLTPAELSVAEAITGASVAFLTWYAGDPAATAGAVAVTLIFTLAQWFHLTETGSTSPTSKAQRHAASA